MHLLRDEGLIIIGRRKAPWSGSGPHVGSCICSREIMLTFADRLQPNNSSTVSRVPLACSTSAAATAAVDVALPTAYASSFPR
jgi:hypothetical protein